MYRIEAVLKSPLMIGGKKLNNNYRESREYIPGSVLRAAYARALIQRCVFEQKNNRLVFQEQSQCEECAFHTVCRHFSESPFPALYPFGGSPYPVTAREKKYKDDQNHKDHKDEKDIEEAGIYDILKSRLTGQGKAQGESEWSRLEGIHKHGRKVRLIHSAITRTAIDYQRNAAKEGFLYTQNVVSEKYLNEKDELCDVSFSGQIRLSPVEERELSQIRVLHIGADTTRGFGICHMLFAEETEVDTPDQIETRIQKFNSGIAGEQRFVILDLLTDAYLELEDIGADSISQTAVSDEQMLSYLENKIGLSNEIYHLRKAFKFQEVYRGIDTSKETEAGMRRQAHLVVQAGAVFVYQALAKDLDKAEQLEKDGMGQYAALLEKEVNGIGQYTEHGFGKIRVCDEFHITYDVSGGKQA